MVDKQRDDYGLSQEPDRGDERDANETPRPHPSPEEAKQEAEEEDRFEATDN